MSHYQSSKQQDYLDFLKFSMAPEGEPVPACAGRIVWKQLLEFAMKQAVVGIFWQGFQRLGGLSANKPTGDDVMAWLAVASSIARQNRKVNRAAVKVTRGFQKQGFDACILKGQGNAGLYPHAELRTPGDVDVYVHPHKDGASWQNDEEDMRKIIAFCKSFDASAKATYHHVDIPSVDGVSVEVHYRLTWVNAPGNNARLQRALSELMDGEAGVRSVSLQDGVGEIWVPGFEVNVIFLLGHLFNHLLHEGVGLRQLIDYYYLLKSHVCSEDERARLSSMISQCGLKNASRAVSWMMVSVLGLPEKYLITAADERYGRQMLREMLAGGNFGKYDERMLSGASSSKLMANIQRFVRDARMMAYYPSECLWEPWFRLWHWKWRIKHNKGVCVTNGCLGDVVKQEYVQKGE